MEEISNPTQIAADQSDVFLEGLENAPAAAEQPLAQEEQAAAAQAPLSAVDPGTDGDGAVGTAVTEPPAVQTKPDRQTQEADIRADLANFASAFPEVFARAKDDPGVIPQGVWDMMHSQGLSLTAAYARYATDQARTAADNRSNAARSTGSMRSAGSDVKNNDAFLSAFEA